ncbi:MAG: hypothetical protein JWN48_4656 [Myxococcaceae bacterium]|nr:hypothetical protein [Myxococcaceae bacterium]
MTLLRTYELGSRSAALLLMLTCSALLGGGCGDDVRAEPHSPAPDDAASEAPHDASSDAGARRNDPPASELDATIGSLDAALGVFDGSAPGDAANTDGGATASADAGPVSQVGPIGPVGSSAVDLLFVVDNSGSMANKQAKLISQVPRLLKVLTTGDRCAGGREASCPFTDTTVPKRLFAPVSSLHVGVVTSNAGGIDDPPTTQVAVASCAGLGDDGKLQNSVSIAVNGVVAGNREFLGVPQGTVIIEPDASCAQLGAVPVYQEYIPGMSAADEAALAARFRCVLRVGVRGCPFEQTLESPWKALAPSVGSGGDYVFSDDSRGQGDRYNKGFLRSDALLAIVLLTDEDDCSITDAGKSLFVSGGSAGSEADTLYGPVNLRCGFNYRNHDLVRDTSRYLRGFRSLKPGHPERVIFAAITGVPPAATAAASSLTDVLALPEMQFREDPTDPGFPLPSCTNNAGMEPSFPPIRIVELARDFGEQGIVSSICAADYSDAIDRVVAKLSTQL